MSYVPNNPTYLTSTGNASNLLVKATGGITNTSVGTVFADVALLRSFGFVGNGTGATLASLYSSLTAAQAVYPHAIALTDTLDWAAIQGLYNSVVAPNANGVSITLPTGDVVINRPIITGAKSFFMRGQGPLETRILMNAAGIDLFQHGLTSQGALIAFELQDLGLYTLVPGAGNAINIRQNMNTGQFRLDNIRFGSFNGSFDWAGFVVAEGTTLATFRDVQASGGSYNVPSLQSACTQVGFKFNSPNNANKSFVFIFDNCQIDSIVNAIQCNVTGVPGDSGSLEGFIFTNCGGRTDTGAWLKVSVPFSSTVWWPPYYIFDKCNMEGPGTLIDIDTVSEFHMTDCLMFVDAYQSGASVGDYIRFGSIIRGYFTNNTFALYANAKINNIISIGAGSTNVVFRDNVFDVSDPSAALTGGIVAAASATNITSFNNSYLGWPTGIPKETGVKSFLLNGVIGVTSPQTSDNWRNQGAYVGWNYSNGTGATTFLNSRGNGAGGFEFYNTASSSSSTPLLFAKIDGAGSFSTSGGINNTAIGNFTPLTGSFTTLSANALPTSPTNLPTGSIWKDTANGNVLKIV